MNAHVKAMAVFGLVGSLAACQQSGPSTAIGTAVTPATGVGIVDATTGRIDPKYLDNTFSLADVVNDKVGGSLDSNDRRFIDAALDKAMAEPPAAQATSWGNPANQHTGSVDLSNTFIDSRKNEACALVLHDEELGDVKLKGDVTFCRSTADTGWRVTSVNWQEVTPVTTSTGSTTTTKPTTTPTKPATTTTTSGGTILEPANTPTPVTNQRKITVPTSDGVPEGDGMQSLGGSILEDQAPHIEAD